MQYDLRILTIDTSRETEALVLESFGAKLRSLSASDISVTPMIRYWKVPGWGEINIRFQSRHSKREAQAAFADLWKDDCADWEWSNIACEPVCFLWLGE